MDISVTQEVAFSSAIDQLRALNTGKITSVELVELYLERIESHADLVAVVSVDREGALQAAREADEARLKGQSWGPLHGLPLTFKDAWATKGLRTVAGIPKYKDNIPNADAPVVANLRAAGAIIMGKTNMPTGNLDLQAANPVFGISRNPWDKSKTTGGSAGGAAAAVAAGLTSIDFASEIAGSIRIPAHYCGVYGHKTSFGITPLTDHIPHAPGDGKYFWLDMALGGPMARNAEDLEIALLAAAAPQPRDRHAWRLELPKPRAKKLTEFRICAWLDDAFCPVGKEVRQALETTIEALESAGAKVDRNPELPVGLAEMHEVFDQLLYSAFAYYWEDEEFEKMIADAKNKPSNVHRDWVNIARDTTIRHRQWIEATIARYKYVHQWQAFFKNYDVMLAPVTPSTALPVHGPEENWFGPAFELDGVSRPYLDQIKWTGFVNLINAPSTSMPIGFDQNNMPIGMQIIGPYLEDLTTIEFAKVASEVTGGYKRPLGY
ncbi:MAG: amidase, partial [Bacteroidota bacterium]